jgi:hypothetical protein
LILVCEPLCHGEEHAAVNLALLSCFSRSAGTGTCVFLAERSHSDCVNALSDGWLHEVAFRALEPLPRHVSEFRRVVPALRVVAALLRNLRPEEATSLVLLNVTPALMMAVRVLLGTRKGRLGVHSVLHSNAAQLGGWRSRNPLRRALDMTTAIRAYAHPRLRILVLERPIKALLDCLLPGVASCVDVLPLPVPLDTEPYASALGQPPPPVRIGFLGSATTGKGFPLFLELAQELSAQHPGLAEFHLIGGLLAGSRPLDSSGISGLVSESSLPRDSYLKRAAEMHYVCLPYDPGHYALSPSGTLLDAIGLERPIIALRTPVTDTLFAEHGAFGHLCGDGAAMKSTVTRVATHFDAREYDLQKAAIRRARRARSPNELSERYRMLIARVFP